MDRTVQQFADAGIRKSADDFRTENRLYWRAQTREAVSPVPDKLTLQRKTRSTLNIPVPVEKVNRYKSKSQKRTFVTRSQEAERGREEQAQREAEEQARREQKNGPNARRSN